MAKSGTYRFAYTYARYNAADVLEYETGRSAIYGPVTVNGSASIGGAYSTDSQINYIRIFSTLNSGGTYYFDQKIANNTAGGNWWTTVSNSDAVLKDRATAYWTDLGYESKRLYSDGVAPPVAFCVEADGRLWGAGRMQRYGTNEQSTLYFSEKAPNWRDWPTRNGISTFAQPITGLYEWNEYVYVFTKNSRFKVTPSPYAEGIIVDKLEGGVGCIGGHTITKVGSIVVWLAQDGFYAVEGDAQPQPISIAIRDTIEALRKDRAGFFQSRFDQELNQYTCYCSDGSTTLNNIALVADFNTGILNPRWTVHGANGRVVHSVAQGISPGGDRIYLLGDHQGNLWQDRIGYSDGANLGGGTYQGVVGTTTSTSTTTTT